MAIYQKIEPIEAEQYKEGLEDGWVNPFIELKALSVDYVKAQFYWKEDDGVISIPFIWTKEGKHYVREGDYICTGIEGERWNVEKNIFERTYRHID